MGRCLTRLCLATRPCKLKSSSPHLPSTIFLRSVRFAMLPVGTAISLVGYLTPTRISAPLFLIALRSWPSPTGFGHRASAWRVGVAMSAVTCSAKFQGANTYTLKLILHDWNDDE